jgi:hypothetical protein
MNEVPSEFDGAPALGRRSLLGEKGPRARKPASEAVVAPTLQRGQNPASDTSNKPGGRGEVHHQSGNSGERSCRSRE